MAIIKGTLLFQQGANGWSESYYREDPTGNLDNNLTKLSTLAGKRIQLCGEETQITFARCSDISVTGDSAPLAYEDGQVQGIAGSHSDVVTTCLLALCSDVTRTWRKVIFLRGIDDAQVANGGKYRPDPVYKGRVTNFKSQLINDAWGWVATDRPTPSRNITNIEQNPDGSVEITHEGVAWPGPFDGRRIAIRISGVQQPKAINGTLVFVPGNAFVGHTYRQIAVAPYTTGGKINFNTKSLKVISNMVIERSGKHSTGRPTLLPAGRQRVRPRY